MTRETKTQQAGRTMKTESRLTAPKGPKIIQTKVFGRVEYFNVNRGFGFIRRRDEAEKLFFHCTSIKTNPDQDHFCSVEEGQEVQFDVVEGRKGPKAANITGPAGVPIQGRCCEVKKKQSKKMEGEKPKEDVQKEILPKELVKAETNITTVTTVTTVTTATMTTSELSQDHLEELAKVTEERERLREEIDALKDAIEKERADVRSALEESLQARETQYQKQLEALKAECKEEVKKEEARRQKQLEDQKDRFKKESESKTEKSWVYAVGGVCLLAGFLSAKILNQMRLMDPTSA